MPHLVKSEPQSPEDAGDKISGKAASSPDKNDDVDMANVDAPENDKAPQIEANKSNVKLEDLFDDAISDEEFPSSRPPPAARDATASSSAEQPSLPVAAVTLKALDSEVMRSFYQRLFPWKYLFLWLNHSLMPTNDFCHREFAFTLQNDAYLRYQAFPTADLLKKDVLRLMPSRFEIGPVYTTNPRDRKLLRNSSAFKPLAKELCFDIDLTDYDEIRTCCDKANICTKCWQFMIMAIKVVDVALRDDFGFRHIMWVYSGRRGAHAWVCDKKARTLTDQKRRAIAGYLEVVRGGAQSGKKVNLRRPLHAHILRSLDLLKTHFQEDVLSVQDPWELDARAEKLLQLLPDRQLNESLRKKWGSFPGRASTSKWADIDVVAKMGVSKSLDAKALREAKQDIVLEYTYPRLDIEVSKKLNHLLKSPFVVHPATGRVCVPIDTRNLEAFDPTALPAVQSLLGEIDAWEGEDEQSGADGGQEGSQRRPVQDWEKTSLKPYIEQFRSFVLALIKEERNVKAKQEREDEGLEF